jgi:amidase
VDQALAKAGFQVVPLDQTFKVKWEHATNDGNTVAAAGAWISDQKYLLKIGVAARTSAVIAVGRVLYPASYEKALKRRMAWRQALRHVFQKVDFIALPTFQSLPPTIPLIGNIAILEARILNKQNTVAVNFGGNPALAIPVPVNDKRVPVTSLQLVGPWSSEAELLNAGRLIEAEQPSVDRKVNSSEVRVRAAADSKVRPNLNES